MTCCYNRAYIGFVTDVVTAVAAANAAAVDAMLIIN